MDFRVAVDTDITKLHHFLNESVRKQIPFATAVALTRVAQGAVNEVRGTLPRKFNLRSHRLPKGIQMNRAEKKDWPNITADVGSKDDFMVLQETGGIKKAKSGSHVAVPTRLVKRTKGGKIRKAQKPSSIMVKKGAIKTSSHIIRKRTKRNPLALMYTLKSAVRIKPVFGMEETVVQHSRATYGKHFKREFAAALASQRRQSMSFSSGQGRHEYLKARSGDKNYGK